jgi:radical SAM superfamily enzyme YgiQ (UPF0313 family)
VPSRRDIEEGLRARLRDEQGALLAPSAELRIALCYPSPYHVGMSSLGFQTIYREIHAHPGCAAERAFLPDDEEAVAAHRALRLPPLTVESQAPITACDALAFSVAYELELAGLLEMLSLAGLPLHERERDERAPLVLAGGPLTFSNPAPLSPFVDLLLLGEAEELIHVFLDALGDARGERLPKRELLSRLHGRPGFFAPALAQMGPRSVLPAVAKAGDERLPARSQIVTPHTELRSMFLIEPERGCSRGCTYCVMRRTTNGGMRTVPPERVLELVPEHARKVGLVGAAVTDHPRIVELVRALVAGGREVGISSLRAEQLVKKPELISLLAQSGARSLTTAADGASERLRTAIDRKTSAQQILGAAQLAKAAGMSRFKLYLMVGLPGETDDDLDELVRFATELSRVLPLSFGCAPFVAKRNTPMDGAPFAGIAEVERKLAFIRSGLKGRAELRPTSARWAWVEYMLAQGGPDAGLAAEDAWRAGGSFAAWKRAFKERAVEPFAGARVGDGRVRLPALAHWPTVG